MDKFRNKMYETFYIIIHDTRKRKGPKSTGDPGIRQMGALPLSYICIHITICIHIYAEMRASEVINMLDHELVKYVYYPQIFTSSYIKHINNDHTPIVTILPNHCIHTLIIAF